MQQLSRTYQIALGAIVVLAIAWFTVLKPKPAETVPAGTAAVPPAATAPKLPGQRGLQGAVAKAKGTAATAAAASAAATGEDVPAAVTPAADTSAPVTPVAVTPVAAAGSTGPVAARGAAAPAARAPKDASAPILRATAHGKVAVLLFFGPGGSDDAAVRRALVSIDRHRGRVLARAVPIARVTDYAAITSGVTVAQAPTILVIGPAREARTLVGFVDTRSIDQLVGDVGGPAFAPGGLRGYRARIQNLCAVLAPTLTGTSLQAPDLQERLAVVRGSLAGARKLRAPRRLKAFQAAFVANLRLTIDAYTAVGAATAAGQNANAALAPFAPHIAASIARVEAAAARARFAPGC